MELFAEQALLPEGWRRDVRLSVTESGTFAEVAPGASPRPGDERLGIAIPSQISLHSHAFQRAMAGLAESRRNASDTFWTWRTLMYRLADRISPEQMQDIATWLDIEMLRAGYTQVAEFHYLHHDADGRPYATVAEMSLRLGEAATESGIGLTLLPTLYARGGFDDAPLQEAQRRFASTPEIIGRIAAEAQAAWRGRPALSVGLGLHSLRAVDIRGVCGLLESAPARLPVHIHVAEQVKEVEDCLAATGARPVEYLLANAPVDDRWCLVHATHLSGDEITGMAASGAVAGLCPITEANLGDGIFPFRPFVEAGGRFGIGTDSNVLISPWEELRTLEYGLRLSARARCAALPGETLGSTGGWLYRRALDGGRRACGLEKWGLETGARADLCVLDAERLSLPFLNGDELLDSAIFASAVPPVKDVLCAGIWRVRDGRHTGEEAAARRFREAIRSLLDI